MQLEDVMATIPGDDDGNQRWYKLALAAWGKEEADDAMYDRLLQQGMDRAKKGNR